MEKSTGGRPEQHAHPSDLIGSVILGLNDGIVTTLVFVLSVSAASGRLRTTVIAGLSEILAGGVSMFLGGYMAARATKEAYQYQVDVEREEIRYEPEEERAEVTEMFQERGFRGPLLEDVVHYVTSDPDRWLRFMVRHELGTPPDERSSTWQVGLAVGGAFILGGLIPLLPFITAIPSARAPSIAASIVALALTGAARSRYSRKTWWVSAAEMVVIGAVGAVAGLVIGAGLSTIHE